MSARLPESRSVIVLGAGPAGLSVAERLTAKGVPTIVIDGAPGVGGLSRSIDLWGHRVDLGPHSFYSTGHPESVRRWMDLTGGEIDRTVPRRGALWHGRVLDFPPSLLAAARAGGPQRSARIAASRWRAMRLSRTAGRPQPTPGDDDPATSARVRWTAQYGGALVDELFAPYTRKLLGLDPAEVDADFAGLLLGSRTKKTDPLRLLTPTEGTGSVWEEAARRVRARGGQMLLGQPVTRIQADSGSVEGVVLRDGTVLSSQQIVSTLPPHILLKCLPAMPDEAIAAAGRLTARDTHLVYLRVARDGLLPWHYLTAYDESYRFGRVTNVGIWRPGRFSTGAGTIICAEYWGQTGDSLSAMSDENLAELAITELDLAGLIPASAVSGHHVVRLPKSVPVLRRGYKSDLAVLRQAFGSIPRLHVVGRHGNHQWDGQEDALVQGATLADAIAADITQQATPDTTLLAPEGVS